MPLYQLTVEEHPLVVEGHPLVINTEGQLQAWGYVAPPPEPGTQIFENQFENQFE